MPTWRDTTQEPAPVDGNAHQRARWLIGRHPRLQLLLELVPSMVHVGWEDDELTVDLNLLGRTMAEYEVTTRAQAEHMDADPSPGDDAERAAWAAAGPQMSTREKEIAAMPLVDQAQLRLLATLGSERVPFRVSDFDGFDAEAGRMITDWCEIITSR